MLPFDPFPGEDGVLDATAVQKKQRHDKFVQALFGIKGEAHEDWEYEESLLW
jgi:hypothetical protein